MTAVESLLFSELDQAYVDFAPRHHRDISAVSITHVENTVDIRLGNLVAVVYQRRDLSPFLRV